MLCNLVNYITSHEQSAPLMQTVQHVYCKTNLIPWLCRMFPWRHGQVSPNKLDFLGMEGERSATGLFFISAEHCVRWERQMVRRIWEMGILARHQGWALLITPFIWAFYYHIPFGYGVVKASSEADMGGAEGRGGGGWRGGTEGCKTLSDCKHSPVTGFGSYMHTHRPFVLYRPSLLRGE